MENYDVFISYRHETGFYMAQILYTKLISNGYTVFMDKTMHSGKYEDKIRTAIANSRNFVVVLFPDDLPDLQNENSWLNIESSWALMNSDITIIPVMCDGFEWPRLPELLTETMHSVKQNNGVPVHKDPSMDTDLDHLCDHFLQNVTPSKPQLNVVDFLKYNLECRTDMTVCGVDMAFHAGAPWLMPGEKNTLIKNSLEKNVRWRVLINTVDAAESIAQHMRDENALYAPFSQVHAKWKQLAALYPDVLEVRACKIPLIHVHHAVKFRNLATQHPYGELHIKYYAYNNVRLDNAYEHELSSFSKYYSIYCNEFEFLWEQSEKL